MPIYEFKCQDCGKLSEFRILSQADTEKLSCQGCGSRKLDRKISIPSISTRKREPSAQTCCGRDQRCSDAGSCCGH
jgi:putative FmdB family regulatory protein